MRRPFSLLHLLCLLPILAAPSPAQDAADIPEEVALARSLDPDDAAGLEALSLALAEAGDADGELAALLYAIDAYDRAYFENERDKSKKIKSLEKRLKKLDTGLSPLKGARNAYLKDLTFTLKLYARNQGKLRSALGVGQRILDYRPDHPTATRFVNDLIKKLEGAERKQAERFVGQQELHRPRAFLTKWAEEHLNWRKAGKFESERYALKTNAGYDVGQIALQSLESIADYFLDFYGEAGYPQKGKVQVNITRTHEEFQKIADWERTEDPGLMAFIRTTPKRKGDEVELSFEVFAYDPRDLGRSLDSLWPTLWHEASHQYMALASGTQPAPLWFNEGMSCYFEGTRFTERGLIEIGRPSRDRLDNLAAIIAMDDYDIPELLGAEGGLNGLQYAMSWGLVYYVVHGRDDQGKLLRPTAVPDAMAAIRRGLVTGQGLFSGTFLRDGESLEDFVEEWSEAMVQLHEDESDPEEFAEKLTGLAMLRIADDDPDQARKLLHQALLRDEDSLQALEALATLERDLWIASKKKDDRAADQTLFISQLLLEAAEANEEEELAAAALEMCGQVDKTGIQKVWKAEGKYRDKVSTLVDRQLEANRPKTALAVAKLFLDDVLESDRHAELAAELREAGTLALERRYKAFDGETLQGLSGAPSAISVKNGTLRIEAERPVPAFLLIDRDLAPLFRLEADVTLEDGYTLFGLAYESPESRGRTGFVMCPETTDNKAPASPAYAPFDQIGRGRVADLVEEYVPSRMSTGLWIDPKVRRMKPPIPAGEEIKVVLSRTEADELVLEVNGEVVRSTYVEETGSTSTLSLMVYGGFVNVTRLEVFELDRM